MKSVLYILPFAFCLLSACDLHDKIMQDGSSAKIQTKSYEYGTSVSTDEYIQPATGDDYIQYANKNDYVMPVQSRASFIKPEKIETTKKTNIVQKSEPVPIIHQKPEPVPIVKQKSEPDDILLVPARVAYAEPKPVIVPPKSGEIIVVHGDTVYSLSKKHGIPLRDLVDTNNLKAPYSLSVGQKLKLPSARIHTVAAGETLYSISRGYSVDLNSLATENNIAAPYALSVGQKLKLPAHVHVLSPVSVPVVMAKPEPVPVVKPEPKIVKKEIVKPVPGIRSASKPELKKVSEKTKISSAPAKPLPTVATQAKMRFSWPVRGKIISGFGYKKNGLYNDGINIGAASGTTVKASEAGVVAYAGNELKGMGNLVIIQHANGWMSVYAHMDSMNVKRGTKIAKGEKIGTVGKTGKVSEPQLHFEIRKGTKAYNPQKELK